MWAFHLLTLCRCPRKGPDLPTSLRVISDYIGSDYQLCHQIPLAQCQTLAANRRFAVWCACEDVERLLAAMKSDFPVE